MLDTGGQRLYALPTKLGLIRFKGAWMRATAMSQIETQWAGALRLLSADFRGEDRSKGENYPRVNTSFRCNSQWLFRARSANFKILQGTRLSQPVKIPSAGNHNTEDTLGGV